MSTKGYMGKILIVDLTTGLCETEVVPDAVYENLLSGVGLGAWYLCNNIPSEANPLGPENILGFTSGLLTSTGSVMTGRWMAVCKSPLTGGWGDSNCGGNLAPAIKQCGVDAVFVKGQSAEPVYIFVDNKGAEIRPAAEYWGLDAIESEKKLISDNWKRKKPAAAVIGPAAERISLISGISNDLGRYAARSGVGAVMGSKKLKGLVLAGTKQVYAKDPDKLKEISKEFSRKVRKSNAPKLVKGALMPLMGKALGSMKSVTPIDGAMTFMLLKKWGSVMNNTMSMMNGDAPIKNWTGSEKDYNFKNYRNLNPDKIIARETRKYHCHSCVIGCGGHCSIKDVKDGKYSDTHKPEYETSMMFGGLLMNKDTDAVFYANELCNRFGLDTISAGGTIAFAIECYENGILTDKDTYGLKLKWGNSDAILELLKKMAIREPGLGDILADGVRVAAEKIGKGSEKYAVHAGGQEPPAHDPKIDPLMAQTYAVDPTPGRHTTSGGTYYNTSALWEEVSWLPPFKKYPKSREYEPSMEETMKNVAYTGYKMLVDGTGSCYYAMLSGVRHFRIFDFLNAATGWSKTPDEYIEIGKRMQHMRQLFNSIQRVKVNDFRPHRRIIGEESLKKGHNAGKVIKIDEMTKLYREAWGWDVETGYPLESTLKEYGIDKLAEEGVLNAQR
jgi:aldehyde:ferredoxin oxidoreductase